MMRVGNIRIKTQRGWYRFLAPGALDFVDEQLRQLFGLRKERVTIGEDADNN